MKNKRSIIIYWVLLLVPTLVIVGLAFLLLSHEQERIRKSALLSLADRATALSETIHITVADLEEELTRSLFEISEDNLHETLLFWEEVNPLIRNIFIWRLESKLEYPVSGMASTREERRFISRYDSLFSGRIAWDFDAAVSAEEMVEEKDAELNNSLYRSSQELKKSFVQDIDRLKSGRRELLDLAKTKRKESSPAESISDGFTGDVFQKKSGWIPWFAENRLFLLGWVKASEDGPVYGVELELMALLSRLITDLPKLAQKGTAYTLVSGNGQILHQSGGFPVDIRRKPDISIPISELLPHWQICVYRNGEGFQAGNGFMVISLILLGIFVTAIISGAALLTNQAQRNMKDAMQKTSFVSSVSHELKTPLTTIRMYAELLQSGRIKDLAKTNHYLSVIVTESQRLTRLVNNVLDFGRLEQGKKKYHMLAIDLVALLHDIVDAHSIRIRNAGIEVNVTIPDMEMSVMTDRDALEQVILNLVDNALKYASEGKIMIFALEDAGDGFYELKICDRGPGIPQAHRESIFEKFHRVDNSLTSKQPGSGLGLGIARQILRDLGGDLLFKPELEGGSCFIARIRKCEK